MDWNIELQERFRLNIDGVFAITLDSAQVRWFGNLSPFDQEMVTRLIYESVTKGGFNWKSTETFKAVDGKTS